MRSETVGDFLNLFIEPTETGMGNPSFTVSQNLMKGGKAYDDSF